MIYVWNNIKELQVLTNRVLHKNKKEIVKAKIYHTMNSQQHPTTPPSRKKGKRFRSAFTTEQVNFLENEFKKYPYIGHVQRKEVATILNIPEKAVKVWFQNRRMREKNSYKDLEFDDYNAHRNMTFGNDQLINVRDVPSVSNQSLCLLPLTSPDTTKNMNNVAICEEDKTSNNQEHLTISKYFYDEISHNRNKSPVDKVHYKVTSPALKPQNSPNYEASAEFSIDLCKKYRSDLIRRYGQEEGSTSETQTSQVKQPVEKDIVVKEELKCSPDNEPQDLSHKSSCRLRLQEPPQNTNRNDFGFQPVYVTNYAQPYLPAANVMWNPVNIVPVLPTGASAISSSNNRSDSLNTGQEQTTRKKPCNCDCHVNASQPKSSEETSQNQHPQYIITAVPFPNYPKC